MRQGQARAGPALAGCRQAAGYQRQVCRQQRQVGVGAASKRRCGESADEAENSAGQAKAEGEHDREGGHACKARKGESRPDQAVIRAGEVEAA